MSCLSECVKHRNYTFSPATSYRSSYTSTHFSGPQTVNSVFFLFFFFIHLAVMTSRSRLSPVYGKKGCSLQTWCWCLFSPKTTMTEWDHGWEGLRVKLDLFLREETLLLEQTHIVSPGRETTRGIECTLWYRCHSHFAEARHVNEINNTQS